MNNEALEAFRQLPEDQQNALAEEMAGPLVVPRHVLISLMMATGLLVELVDDGSPDAINYGRNQDLVRDRDTTEAERREYAQENEGHEPAETVTECAGEIYSALDWAQHVLDPHSYIDDDATHNDDVEALPMAATA